MPTRPVAVALVVVVLLSGCSMLPGGGGGVDVGSEAPAYHALSYTSHTDGTAFEATVTVERNGSVVHEQTIQSDGRGAFANLTTLDEPGPYTVTVNTTIPAAGGDNRSDRMRIDGTLGNETVLEVTYRGIYTHSVALPREEMTESVYVHKETDLPVDSSVVIEHRGETVYAGDVPTDGPGTFELTTLPKTGAYRVAVSGLNGERWTNDTVVVRDPGSKLYLDPSVSDGGDIEIYPPGEQVPQ